jgi:hypothetical protein
VEFSMAIKRGKLALMDVGHGVARHCRKLLVKNLPRAVAALSMLCMTTCSNSLKPDVQFLASNVYFIVGGQNITIPVVAIRGPDHTFDLGGRPKPQKSLRQTLESEASDPRNPMKRDSLDLSVRQYQYAYEHLESTKICALLTRTWSQAVCRGEHRGLLRRMPEKFDLVDRAKLDLLRNHIEYDQVRNMAIQPGVTEIGCDRDSRFCTAMVEALPGLLAVWTVWSDETTGATAESVAATQGASIVQFVRRALGPVEDLSLVDAD